VALGAAALVAQVGCEVDAWMFDPSVVGRWEHTPTVVPILDRIDVIESDTGEFVDVTEVLPEDLIPEAAEYRLGPGDVAQIEIMDIVVTGQPVFYERVVDRTGFLEIPQIGRIPVAGRTQDEARRMIEQAIIDQELVRDQPLVNLMVPGQRQATFSIFGAIQQPARYSIPYPDYRLLEAATDAGGVSPIIRHIFVIRQVPLSDAIDRSPAQAIDETQRPGEPIRPDRWTAPMDDDGDDEFQDIDDLIDELTNPESNPPVDPPGSPGVVGSASPRSHNVLEPHQALRPSHYDTYRPSPTALQDDDEPLIDLPDTAPPPPPVGGAIDLQARAQPVGPADGATGGAGAGRWVFIDGRWVQVVAEVPAAVDELPEGPDPLASGRGADDLLTQRVIRVPVKPPCFAGDARYNIVVRPGDVIHVPPPESGNGVCLGDRSPVLGCTPCPASGVSR
jgi:protein involved in polysaccharide export with SLBB domain